jgi:competence protein ComEC
VLAALAWVPATWIAAVAGFFAAAPAARLPWPGGALGAVALALVTALAVAAVLGRRRWALVAVALLVVVYAGLVAGDRIAQLVGRPANWQFAGCDVGQGDAFLIRSAGQVALIDTGPEPAPLKACLDDLGVGRIDLLVLTHFDLDHVGGVQAVTGRVDRVIVGPSGGPDNDRLTAALGAQQVARGPGGLLGELRWSVLWPPQRLAGIEPGNEASVTVAFEPVGACVNGCLSGLFLGDLGESAQDRVLRANPVGTFDVVKVSHHGSSDQSEALYQRVQATVGMIGVGADNGYGHPTERLLDILARVGTVPVRTDEDGLILLSPGAEPGTVSVWTQR